MGEGGRTWRTGMMTGQTGGNKCPGAWGSGGGDGQGALHAPANALAMGATVGREKYL